MMSSGVSEMFELNNWSTQTLAGALSDHAASGYSVMVTAISDVGVGLLLAGVGAAILLVFVRAIMRAKG